MAAHLCSLGGRAARLARSGRAALDASAVRRRGAPGATSLDRAYGVLDNAKLHHALDISSAHVIRGFVGAVSPGVVTLRDGADIRARRVVDDPRIAPRSGVRRADRVRDRAARGGRETRSRRSRLLVHGLADRQRHHTRRFPLFPVRGAVDVTTPCCSRRRSWWPARAATGRTASTARRAPRQSRRRAAGEPRGRTRPVPGAGAAHPPAIAAFGARAGLIHRAPDTASRRRWRPPDAVVAALVAENDPRKALWPWQARAVRALREVGLSALLDLDPARTAEFFDAFFALPAERQRAYLSGLDDVRGTATTMWQLFCTVSPPIRRTLPGPASGGRDSGPQRTRRDPDGSRPSEPVAGVGVFGSGAPSRSAGCAMPSCRERSA